MISIPSVFITILASLIIVAVVAFLCVCLPEDDNDLDL